MTNYDRIKAEHERSLRELLRSPVGNLYVSEYEGTPQIITSGPHAIFVAEGVDEILAVARWMIEMFTDFDQLAAPVMAHDMATFPSCPSCNVQQIRNGDEFVCDNPKCERRGVA